MKSSLKLAFTLGGAALLAAMSVSAKTTITYSSWGNTEELAVEKRLINAFEEANPTISVKLIAPSGNYEEQLTVMIAGGSTPDVISLGRTRLPDFATALQPIPVQGIDKGDYLTPAILSSLTYKGDQLGLPKRMNTKVMFYDRGAFNRAGIPVPTSNWTPANYSDAAKKLTQRSDNQVQRWGSGPLIIWNWLTAFNAKLYNTEMTKSQFTSPDVIEATKFMAGLHKKYAGWFDDYSNFDQALYTGKVGMYADIGPWYLPGLANAKGIDWRLVETPGAPLDPEVVGLSISKTSKYAKEALTFAKFVSSSSQAQSIIANGTNLPVTKAGAKKFVEKAPDKELGVFTNFLAKYTFPQLAQHRVNVSSLDGTIWDTFYQKILTGSVDVLTGLKDLDQTIQSRLSSMK